MKRLPIYRLTLIFLSIIMTMSIVFSAVFFITSAHVLDTRPNANDPANQVVDRDHNLDEWIGRRSNDGKANLMMHLIILNIGALLLGVVVSYILARIALRPVELALAEQEQFMSDASHELRTPITAALISNEVALRNPNLDIVKARDVLKENVHDMQDLKRLTDHILDQTKADTLHEEQKEVTIFEFIDSTMKPLRHLANSKKIILQNLGETSKVTIYPRAVKTILTILIDNAIKYSNENTSVIVKASVHSHLLTLEVHDQGIGIDKHELKYIFDRFYRIDTSRSKQEGHGLGLSIVTALLKNLNGNVSVKSTLHHGSQFIITIPC